MKTTIEISDPLLRQARELAAKEGVTLSALVERALSYVLDETRKHCSFKLRRTAFKGNGVQVEFRDASWETISEAAYERRARLRAQSA